MNTPYSRRIELARWIADTEYDNTQLYRRIANYVPPRYAKYDHTAAMQAALDRAEANLAAWRQEFAWLVAAGMDRVSCRGGLEDWVFVGCAVCPITATTTRVNALDDADETAARVAA